MGTVFKKASGLANRPWRYILSLVGICAVPTVTLWFILPHREQAIVGLMLAQCMPFLTLWDMASTESSATKKDWIWAFNPKSVLNISFLGLPVEEYAFMIVLVSLPVGLWEFMLRFGPPRHLILILIVMAFLFSLAASYLRRPDRAPSRNEI